LGPKCAERVKFTFLLLLLLLLLLSLLLLLLLLLLQLLLVVVVMKGENRWIRLRHLRSKPCGIKLIKISPEAGSLIWSEEEQNLRTPEAARTGN